MLARAYHGDGFVYERLKTKKDAVALVWNFLSRNIPNIDVEFIAEEGKKKKQMNNIKNFLTV